MRSKRDASPIFALVAAVAVAAVMSTPAGGQTISSNPWLYREWMRQATDKDLADLYKSTSELVRLLDGLAPSDSKSARKHADLLVKRAHDAWSNAQLRKPTRERPKADPAWRPRDLQAARADAVLARDLVRQAATALKRAQRSRGLDAGLQVTTLDTLEHVELIGLRLKVDLSERSPER